MRCLKRDAVEFAMVYAQSEGDALLMHTSFRSFFVDRLICAALWMLVATMER